MNRFKIRVYDRKSELYLTNSNLLDININELSSDGIEIEQCTGRTDIYNNLIFEGDLVALYTTIEGKEYKGLYEGKEYAGIVRFGLYNESNLGFFIEWPEKVKGIYKEAFYWDKGFKIVGNVHNKSDIDRWNI